MIQTAIKCSSHYSQHLLPMLVAVIVHTNSISVGMSQGFSSVLIPQLQDENSTMKVDNTDASWIASLGVISTPGGALVSGVMSEFLGRKATVQLTALPFLLGSVIMAFSSDKILLCSGRFITGLAIGMASVCYVYVAEVTLPSQRGLISALGPVFVSLGVLLVYWMGYFLEWHSVSIACGLVALLSFALIHFLPETPAWLVSKNRISQAKNSLAWLRGSKEAAQEEIKQIQQSHTTTTVKLSYKEYFLQCKQPTVWKPFLILVVFFICQEGSGMYIVLYYATSVFQEIGSEMNSSVESIILSGVRLAMSAVGSVCIQYFSRRSLSITSGLGMGATMASAATYQYVFGSLPIQERPLPFLPLICMLLNVCSSMLGLLQLPWLMIGELFPLSVRGLMSGIVSSLAYLFIFATVKLYPDLLQYLGLPGMMYLFAVISFLSAIFAFAFLPETQGKTLIEIENSFLAKSKESRINRSTGSIYVISK